MAREAAPAGLEVEGGQAGYPKAWLKSDTSAWATARRSVDGRLSGAQAELALQEEGVRRSERERRAALDRVTTLERSLQAAESELRTHQVGMRHAW